MSRTTEKRPVLIVVVEYGELPEMLRVADILHDGLKRNVIVFFAKRYYRRLAEDSAQVVARGHAWMDWRGTTKERAADGVMDEPPIGSRDQCRHKPSPWWRAAIGDVLALARDFWNFRRRYRAIAAIVHKTRPALVIVGQDLIGKELSFALIAARRTGVPTIIVPFAMFSVRELAEYAQAHREHHLNGRPLNRLAARLFPRWVLDYEGQRLLRLPGSRALALELAGLIHGQPWTPCSEPATAVACDSTVGMRTFAASGVPKARLRVVGSPVHDRLAQALAEGSAGRARLTGRHGLDAGRPLVVCGWPANIFAWLGDRAIEYGDYTDLSSTWAEILARARERHGVAVLVCVHPKTLDQELAAARAAGIPCHKGSTEEAIAHCELFVTLNGSSITAWAIACGKPVLLYDCYRTGYTDFEAVPGCAMARDKVSFDRELEHLCASRAERQALAASQATVAQDWGKLDGSSSQRLLALSLELMHASE